MGFPDKKEIKRALRKLKKAEGSLVLPSDASISDRVKYDLCRQFVTYKLETGISLKDMAEELEIDAPRLSKLLHYRIDLFTADKLMDLLIKIRPSLKVRIS